MARTIVGERFYVEIIKPSHYDDDGYVIQWARSFIPSNSLACVHALVHAAGARHVLGGQVEVVTSAYDEMNTVIPVQQIIRRIQSARGLVMIAGVQSNQFPRAADLAREFRAASIPVVIGGFHVSGSLAMLPEMPPELKQIQREGVVLFAGEAEGRMEQLLRDAYHGRLKPVYNYLEDLPDLRGQEMPYLPPEIVRRMGSTVTFDAGRGCPFQCSFCTIINVHGRKSRFRDADDVERLVRAKLAAGVNRFFITDDDLARNKNWEPIFDRFIALREREGWMHLKLKIQVDTQSHKIPGFIEKAVRAGCTSVFLGLESVNPENLAAARKKQNHADEYRTMLQAWRSGGVLTQAGYIIGFPADTPESVERDIRMIQRELPVDILEFFIMTPLPGSADHRDMYLAGKWMDADLNRYDTEHPTAEHPRMSAEEWKAAYDRAWHLYYSPEHVETLMRRARAAGIRTKRLLRAVLTYYGSYRFEGVHPLQAGLFRRKVRRTRRPGIAPEHPLLFYPRRAWQILTTYASAALYYFWLCRLRKRIERDPVGTAYTDAAIANSPVNTKVRRKVTGLPGHDPTKALDEVWFTAFKKNRARQNEVALARLEREGQKRSKGSRTARTALSLAVTSHPEQPMPQRAKCEG
jgi:radical SAM superfamily enzyme YgiQ (UPF0313 family)